MERSYKKIGSVHVIFIYFIDVLCSKNPSDDGPEINKEDFRQNFSKTNQINLTIKQRSSLCTKRDKQKLKNKRIQHDTWNAFLIDIQFFARRQRNVANFCGKSLKP